MKVRISRLLFLAPLPTLAALAAFAAPPAPLSPKIVPKIAADAAAPSAAADQKTFDTDIRPLLAQYCGSCHGDVKPPGGINTGKYHTIADLRGDPASWRKILSQIRDKTMPPAGMPQPGDTQRAHLAGAIDDLLNADNAAAPPDPGHVVLHRLNRNEYNNTIRDLLGVDTHPADAFPADGSGGGGFDNNADTLFLPPVLMERYLRVAGDVLLAAKPERLFPARPSKKMPPRSAARVDIERMAAHAFRRPLAPHESDRLMVLYDTAAKDGANFDTAVRFAMKGVLVSPSFLFRIEQTQGGDDKAAHPLDDYALASRLSYFLWSSLPDDTLFHLAGQKKLHDPAVLRAQVTRMLADPKARAFSDGFAGQWLRVRELYSTAQPDPRKFPDWNPALRDALYQEPVLLFESIVREDSSLLGLLDSDYTYLNEALAKHYGIPGVAGPQMRRVALADHKRGGVLTMGATLTLTSYPQRTSPVLRGKWVLEQILGAPAPPPPANVNTLSPDDKPKAGLTFRQRLEQHRTKPACAGCHARMDPLGFGLENFDAIGRWRTDIGGVAVDSSGVLTTGEKFSGPEEMKTILMARKDEFTRNLSEKMLSYALGRGLEDYDLPAVKRITTTVQKDGYRSDTLIEQIVTSYPFLYRKG